MSKPPVSTGIYKRSVRDAKGFNKNPLGSATAFRFNNLAFTGYEPAGSINGVNNLQTAEYVGSTRFHKHPYGFTSSTPKDSIASCCRHYTSPFKRAATVSRWTVWCKNAEGHSKPGSFWADNRNVQERTEKFQNRLVSRRSRDSQRIATDRVRNGFRRTRYTESGSSPPSNIVVPTLDWRGIGAGGVAP